jgi:nucleoside-diphosphate-sugar epimerase
MAGKVGAEVGESKAGRLFCFGLGYTAQALARLLEPEGWTVAAAQRDRPLDPARLAEATHVLSSVPPNEQGDPVLAAHAAELARLAGVRWVGYLSTTGVYGDHGGGWVDETTPENPIGERGRRRVEAERGWRALPLPVHVFRLAGIYGPGRSQLDALRAGTAKRIAKPGQVFSRIHVDDIASALRLSMAKPQPGAIYNLADDEPAPPQDVVAYAAELLGVAPPPPIPFAEAELSPMAASFYAESKRVSNARIKRELGWRPRYPSYREGLRALL